MLMTMSEQLSSALLVWTIGPSRREVSGSVARVSQWRQVPRAVDDRLWILGRFGDWHREKRYRLRLHGVLCIGAGATFNVLELDLGTDDGQLEDPQQNGQVDGQERGPTGTLNSQTYMLALETSCLLRDCVNRPAVRR